MGIDHREAIAARFAEATGRPLEAMRELAESFKPDAFDADGELDVDAADGYARRMLGGPPPADPVRDSVRRSRPSGSDRGSGSTMSDRRAEVAAQQTARGNRRHLPGERP